MSNSVEKYLKELDEERRHETLMGYMQYPRTDKLHKNDTPVAICSYQCKDKVCDFKKALLCVQEDIELRAFGSQDFLKQVVTAH